MRNDKGFTLVEVVVCSIIIALLTISLVIAFSSIRQVNKSSSDIDAAVSLSDTIIEKMRTIKYDDITEAKLSSKLTLPSEYTGYSCSNVSVRENSKSFEINNIVYDLSNLNAKITVSPADNSINEANFTSIGDIASSTSCIIDSRSTTNLYRADFLKNEDGSYKDSTALSYDNLTVQDLMIQNNQYLEAKYNDLASKTDGEDIPLWGTGEFVLATEDEIYQSLYKTTDVTFTKDGAMFTVNAYVNYKINREDLFGQSTITKQYKLIDNKKFKSLTDLYIIYENTKCVSDTLTIYNGAKNKNGEAIDNAVELNLFFIIPNKYTSDYVTINKSLGNYTAIVPANLVINNLVQRDPNPKLVTCYTNVKNLSLGSCVANIITNNRVNKEEDKRTRLYDVTIDIEDSSGANVCSKTVTSALK